jgi:Uma2 family endonuclease
VTQAAAPTYHWSRDEFLRAWEAGVFDHRVELVNGEVWPVVIGLWHGDAVVRLIKALPDTGVLVTASTLPTGDSLPDPDCWVRRANAEPVGSVSSRLFAWDPSDVPLVVEVSDETVLQDLQIKAKLYGAAGYPVYWVVTREAIYEHTGPHRRGYEVRREYLPGARIPVGYADIEIAVDRLIRPS